MNSFEKRSTVLNRLWESIAAFGAWIAVVAGSFLVPLPEWGSIEQHQAQTKFVLFVATVIGGFSLLLTFKRIQRKHWLFISLVALVAVLAAFWTYNNNISKRTLEYSGKTVVVGSELLNPTQYRERIKALKISKNDVLKYVGGRPDLIWTSESIETNKWILVVLLSLNYCLIAVFLVTFTNTIKLYTQNDEV